MTFKQLTPIEARVLATLMEKARTVPDSYPLSLNALVLGCNQKTSRDPVMEISDDDARLALEALKARSLVFEGSSSRVPRYEHNFMRVADVTEQQAVLLGLLMLRGPQTPAELRTGGERWYKFADAGAVEAVLQELQTRGDDNGAPMAAQAAPRPRRTRAALGAPVVRRGRRAGAGKPRAHGGRGRGLAGPGHRAGKRLGFGQGRQHPAAGAGAQHLRTTGYPPARDSATRLSQNTA